MLKSAKCFSLTIDGATDVSGIEQESLYIHVCHKGEKVKRFLEFISSYSTSSEDIHQAVLESFKCNDIEVQKLIGTTTDGASNMLGCKKG